MDPLEQHKIEQLLAAVGKLKDAQFIRKGQPYDCETAVQFLRAKWQSMKEQVKTARDFVALASGGNMGTGTPYFIRYADGREVTSWEVLRNELDRLEAISIPP